MGSLRELWTDPALRVMCIALALVGCVIATIAPYQSLMAVQIFDLSETTYAAVLFCAALVTVSTSLSIGVITDQRAKRRGAAMFCALSGILGAGLVAMVQAPWAFVVTHVVFFPLMATLFGQIFGMVRLITQDRAPDARDAVLSAVRALFALPFVIVLPLWAVAFSYGFPLGQLYWALLLFCLALLAIVVMLWPRDGSTRWADTASGLPLAAAFGEVLKPHILIRVLCVGLLSSGVTLYMVLLGLTFAAAPLRTTADVALFSGVMAGLEVPVMLGMALILRHMRRLAAIVIGTLIYAAFLATYPWLANTTAIWLMVLPGAFGGAIMLSLPLAYLQDLMGTRAGAGGALLALNLVVSQGTAALIFALGTTFGGYATASAIGAVVMVLGVAALWRLDRPQPAKNPGPV